jgi:hypothetical protein
MIFNVITPMNRFNNFDKLKNSLSKFKILWHVISDEDSSFEPTHIEEWIKYYKCPNNEIEFWERCNNSINWFLDNFLISDDNNFYCILNDDDNYEDNFFEKIKDGISESKKIGNFNELVICSMLRGHNTPNDVVPIRRHPTTTLLADKGYMFVGGVGVEQFIISGRLLKNHRLPLTTCGDGELITELTSKYEPIFLKETYVLFNYFEPGRWNI